MGEPMSNDNLRRFYASVRQFISSLDFLTHSEKSEVEHLLDHKELGEGLRALAWIIVDEEKVISEETYRTLIELSSGLVLPEHMPADLHTRVALVAQGE